MRRSGLRGCGSRHYGGGDGQRFKNSRASTMFRKMCSPSMEASGNWGRGQIQTGRIFIVLIHVCCLCRRSARSKRFSSSRFNTLLGFAALFLSGGSMFWGRVRSGARCVDSLVALAVVAVAIFQTRSPLCPAQPRLSGHLVDSKH